MKLVSQNPKTFNRDYGVIGTPSGLRLPNGTKLCVGDLVEARSRRTNNVYPTIVIEGSMQMCLAGFGASDWDDIKSGYVMRRITKSDKVTGNEKVFSTFKLELVK